MNRAAALLVLGLAGSPVAAGPPPARPLTVTPGALSIMTGQCNGRDLVVGLVNTTRKPIYADAALEADPALHLPRRLISSWLPPGYTRSVPVAVRAAPGAGTGTHHVRVSGGGTSIDVPVRVSAPPPGADLMRLAARVSASSARATGPACAAIDGKTETIWNDATGKRWPDWWQLDWDASHRVSRVEVVTTAEWGLRDWDVQVAVPNGWATVRSVRGNTAVRNVAIFAARRTKSVRIVTLAGNAVNDQSRLAEVVIR
ncbi:discoidin domain-containing protein [Actinoplanes oblitus]|uniref:Discoidin domain-containing protein n=1 Tax=Actinoplanes oblitus TaxID=3040509 RepID=A0ABY8WSH6_9ACTN|nr:discoidin domain-containing protein [Actinoplanes oblitus]WIM99239.1 discoidin domain-containing protein [Actinoplanes oblitus]